MSRYEGLLCPICQKPLGEDEPVTVCPICGTPQHLACYKELGHCVNEDWHAEGKKFSREQAFGGAAQTEGSGENGETDNGEHSENRCPACGNICHPGMLFCTRCGAPLGRPQQGGANNPFDPQHRGPQAGGFPGGVYFVMPPYGGMKPDEELHDGITVKEYADFIGPSHTQYLLRFRRMKKKGTPFSWNFLFGIGSVFYTLYRKMYTLGIPLLIYALFYAGINMATSILMYQSMFSQMGAISSMIDMNQLMAQAMTALPVWLVNFYTATRYTLFPIFIALGLFGDKVFFDHCTRRIKEIKAKESDPEKLHEALVKAGGVNKKLMMVVLIVIAVMMFGGPMISMLFM